MSNKNIKGFLNEIEEYDKFRSVLRLIYMFGAFSDKDIVESQKVSISSRSLADYVRRIDNYVNFGNITPFGSHNLDGRKTDKKSRCFYTDVYKYNNNFLLNTFNQHTITQSDLIFYIYFLILFSPYEYNFDEDTYNLLISNKEMDLLESFPLRNDSFTFDELFASMEQLYENNAEIINILPGISSTPATIFPLTSDVCKAKLEELCDLGIVERMTESSYRIADYPFPSNEAANKNHYPNLLSVRKLCDFFKNIGWISVPGKNIVDKLDSALMSEEYIPSGLTVNPDNFFKPYIIYECVNYQNIIDNDITWNIINAIIQKRVISYRYQVQDYSTGSVYNTIPLKIVVDKQYGRQYLWGRSTKAPGSYKKGDFTMHRLDRISDIHLNGTFSQQENEYLDADYANDISKDVSIHFKVDSYSDMQALFATLEAYDMNGEIENFSDKNLTVDYHIRTSNIEELTPWLNSLNYSFEIDSAVNPAFSKTYSNYIKEWLNLYEPI